MLDKSYVCRVYKYVCKHPYVSWEGTATQGRKFRLTVGGDNIHKISQEQFLKGTQIIQLKLFL